MLNGKSQFSHKQLFWGLDAEVIRDYLENKNKESFALRNIKS